MSDYLTAVVYADQIDIRFPFSGLISQVFKHFGDSVAKGEVIAQLDTKILQTELEKELADYEKIRARFEIFNQEHPTIADDTLKFLKVIEQADLNASVKSVEMVKARLDQAKLVCPLTGIVISDGGCRAGIFATPSSNSFSVLDLDSRRLRVELDSVEVALDAVYTAEINDTEITLKPSQIIPSGKKFIWDFYLQTVASLNIGAEVTINITLPS